MDAEENTPRIEHWLQLPALRLLTEIADQGSLSAAARAVGMAQSNATRAVKTLERRLGYTLIRRSSRGSTLTPEGILTVEWAREIFDSIDKLAAGTAALATPAGEELSVSASMTVAEYLFPAWLGAFQARMPAARASLRILNSEQVIESIRTGSSALGFIESPTIPVGLTCRTVWSDQLVIVVGTDHPWAHRQGQVTEDELACTPLVEREKGSGTRAFLDHAIGGKRPAPVVELTSSSAICQGVIAGLGPAVLSRLVVENAVKAGGLVEVPFERALERQLRAIWRGRQALTGAAQAFLEIATAEHESARRRKE